MIMMLQAKMNKRCFYMVLPFSMTMQHWKQACLSQPE